MSASCAATARFPLLCFGFVVCGIVTVLPGPLLPIMAARWGLPDVQSGGFFAAEFATSMVGSILSSRAIRRNLPSGFAVMTAGVLLLIASVQTLNPSAGHALALAAFAVIGFGTGLSVTATNLTVAAMNGDPRPSGSRVSIRARRLSIVNVWWGIGAVACPWLIAWTEHAGHMRPLLFVVSLASAGLFVALLPRAPAPETAAVPAPPTPRARQTGILVYFAAFMFLYVGVETVIGGWITTYAHRFSGMTLAHASLMVSLYWAALLTGRWLGSVALHLFGERTILLPSLALSLIAVAVLFEPRSTPAVLVAVAAAGAGFGPVFPIGASRMLARLADHRNAGWAFAMCAAGGAVLPWLTGLVSTRSGSLRVGFAVPLVALVLILILAAIENAVLTRSPFLMMPQEKRS